MNKKDLSHLKELALTEHKNFFIRNPHLKKSYSKELIGICLCQGAASHYLNPKIGIKDFDIWHFYEENKNENFPYRANKPLKNGYKGIQIDFLKREIPTAIIRANKGRPGKSILAYLLQKKTTTQKVLLKKAVIGLYPYKLFGKILWEGTI